MSEVQLMPYLWIVIGVLTVLIVVLIVMLKRATRTVERALAALNLAHKIAARSQTFGYSGSDL